MRSIAFGALHFDRRSIPAELSDIQQWPNTDESALSEHARSQLARRVQAMILFVDGHTPLRDITRQTNVGFNDLYRMFERCVARHEDGRIFGCRALIPYKHTRAYERCAPVTSRCAGQRQRCEWSLPATTAALPRHCTLDRAQSRRS